MNGTMNIEIIPHNGEQTPNRSDIKRGPLKLPEGVASTTGDLIAIGENDEYLHCVFAKTGTLYQIFKSDDPDHMWHVVLELNGAV